MRAATIVLAVTLASAAPPARAQDIQGIFDELRRVLTPDEERSRTERRERSNDYQRGDDGDYRSSDRREEYNRRDGEGTRYGERYEPADDRFWSEEARRVGYREMGDEERRRYDGLSGRDRDRFDEEAGYERKQRYERMSDSERRRYDEALEDAYNQYRRRRG